MSDEPLYISLGALVLAVFSLGWNFYRDVILKARLKVRISISNIIHGDDTFGPFIVVSVTNMGPGNIVCDTFHIAKKPWLARISLRLSHYLGMTSKFAIIVHDYPNQYSSTLPKKLEIGEKMDLMFPSNENAFLAFDPTHVGVTDSFGRYHWSTRKSLKHAKNEYFKEFRRKAWD